MSDPALPLKTLKREHDFLVGIDSDGCAFDTMKIKHKDCFTPNMIKTWGLQEIAQLVRETEEFVNLYSKWRGINRFPALIKVFDLLAKREEVIKSGLRLPDIDSLRRWAETETRLGNPALEKEAVTTGDPVLKRALEWSKAVNDTIAKVVHGVPPFPFVKESIARLSKHAEVIIISQTPGEALEREWAEHGIEKYVKVTAGQEMGTKAECLGFAKEAGGYRDDHVLMIGDAPGDLKAARSNNALFYPINPGEEEKSWRRFYQEALDTYLLGKYRGSYEDGLIAGFEACLPLKPPWEK